MPWRLQAWSNFFSVSVCVCPLFLWEIVNLSLLDIYSWRNRRRRASIVSPWFSVLPCHVSTDWSSAVECPKMPKVNACRAKTQLMICIDLLQVHQQRFAQQTQEKWGWFSWFSWFLQMSLDHIGSNHLSVAVLEALWSLAQSRAHRLLQETCHKWIYVSQKAILLMNDEMMKWTHMNASSLHFPMNTRRSCEAHNLSEAFARPWPFQLLFLLLKVHESSISAISLSAKHTKLKSTSKALFEFVRQSWCRLSGVQEAGLLRVRAVLCPEFTGVVLLDLARDWYMDYIKAC